MLSGLAPGVGTAYSVMTPSMVMRPILLLAFSANHMAPSGPAVIPVGAAPLVRSANSVTTPPIVIRPILLPVHSVNHMAPSGPAAIPKGRDPAVGTG